MRNSQLKIITEKYFENYIVDGQFKKGGGQGKTHLLKEKSNLNEKSILKVIKYDRLKNRRRFHIERTALETLNSEDINIPKLLDSNSENYNEKNIPLYIRTSFIAGDELNELIKRDGPLYIDAAIDFGLQLFNILNTIHGLGIIHRDIKPRNIIINNSTDLFLVDFGLSYTEIQEESVTNNGDILGNSFFSLHELRIEGEDKRDERTDISMAFGILYYLLTGCKPIENEDSSGKMPHERDCYTDIVDMKSVKIMKLNALFDMAFQTNKSERIQSSTEAIQFLNEIKNLSSETIDLNVIAQTSDSKLVKLSPKIKAKIIYESYASSIPKLLKEEIQKIQPEIEPYILSNTNNKLIRSFEFQKDPNELVCVYFPFGLRHKRNSEKYIAMRYIIYLNEYGCELYRLSGKTLVPNPLHVNTSHEVIDIEKELILKFSPKKNFDLEIIKIDFRSMVQKAILMLTEYLLEDEV